MFAADFSANENPNQFRPDGGGYGWGVSAGRYLGDHLSLEAEFLWARRDGERISDSVLPGTANNNVRIISMGLSLHAKLHQRFTGWQPFVGGGVGLFDSELFTTDPDSGLFTAVGGPSSETSTGYQLTA
ncbi:MAG: outer membrane beta-barrel protein, partial [Acidobacteriota bacterium]